MIELELRYLLNWLFSDDFRWASFFLMKENQKGTEKKIEG